MSFRDYAEAGWRLCAIEPGRKSPNYAAWQSEASAIVDPDIAAELKGAGLLHAYSGTCAIDIDAMEFAAPWFEARGVDLQALLGADNAVCISSGRPGRAKLLYRMRRPLTTFRPKGSGVEFRCATAAGTSVQDVLPPSVHPDTGRPYEWAGGLASDWRDLPPVPASILALWRAMLAEEPAGAQLERVDSATPIVDLTRLRKAAFAHSPDCEYDAWLRVGSQLHEGTGGAQEGLEIWQAWSRGVTRIKYPGDELLKLKYMSFRRTGANLATGAALAAELPAQAEDFELIPPEEPEPADAAQRLTRREKLDKALANLERNLVYVRSADAYFDFTSYTLLHSDKSIRNAHRSSMPFVRTEKKGQIPRRYDPVPFLEDSDTKTIVSAVAFHPGKGRIFKDLVTEETYANCYQDKRPAPEPGTKEEIARIEFLFDRIDDPVFREWLRQFFGHIVQRPGVKINSAPLIWSSTQGNGKTTLLKIIPSLLVGLNYSKEISCAMLNSDFNDYLVNAWHVNLTEFRAGTRGEREAITDKLKAYISDSNVSLHPKGSPGYTMPNHFFVTATSNKDDAAAIDNDDRRWAVHELHAPQFTPKEQEWVYTEFLKDARRASAVLQHYFLNVSLDGFSASATAPYTEAKAEMAEASNSPDYELLKQAFEEQSEPLDVPIVRSSDVMRYVHKHCVSKPTQQRIGKMLARAPFNGTVRVVKFDGKTFKVTILRDKGYWLAASGQEIFDVIHGNNIDFAN